MLTRTRNVLTRSALCVVCLHGTVAWAQVVFEENFDAGTAASRFDVFNFDDDFQVDFNYNYGNFNYVLFPEGPAGEAVIQPIPPAPGGSTTIGLRMSVNDVDPAAFAAVHALPKELTLVSDFRVEFDMWMNYNGAAGGGIGSTESVVVGLNKDGSGVVRPLGTANGWSFSATGEGGAAGDYRIHSSDGNDDGPQYPKVNATWTGQEELRYDRTTGELVLVGGTVLDEPDNNFNSIWDSVFPNPEFETLGAPGKHWVSGVIEQRGTEAFFILNGHHVATLFLESPATGRPSFGYADNIAASLADPAVDNFILYDNIKVTQLSSTQFNAVSGNYSNAANWTNGVPNSADAKAYFDGASGPATVNVDLPVTVRSIAFGSSDSYAVEGASTITLSGLSSTLISNAGSHTISAPVDATGHLSVYTAPGTELSVTNLTQDSTKFVAKAGSGTFAVNRLRSAGLTITGGTLKLLPGGGTTRLNDLALRNLNRTLDITDNQIILDYVLREAPEDPATNTNPFNRIRDEILAGYNGGNWQGTGITSSTAASTPGTGIGFADAALLFGPGGGMFAGEAVDASTILIKHTYLGDSNLDGQVDVADLGILASNWQTAGNWGQADFDYSGFIDVADLGMLASNWQAGVGSPLGPSFAEALAAVGLGGAAVPEPAAATFAALGALGLMHRRRKPQ